MGSANRGSPYGTVTNQLPSSKVDLVFIYEEVDLSAVANFIYDTNGHIRSALADVARRGRSPEVGHR